MTTTVPRLRPSLVGNAPGLQFETTLWEAGNDVVVGIDEVGRGAWAGPLTLGAVVVPRSPRMYKIRDSKQLTEEERETLVPPIKEWVEHWSVGHVTAEECDALGMSEAQQLGARRAIEALGVTPDHVLVDGPWNFVGGENVTTIVRGDGISLSIAAASIIAKVTRDTMMRDYAESFPWYNFSSNKGYPCPRHRSALKQLGPSTIHRTSWTFMEQLPWSGVKGCDTVADALTLF